MKRRESFDGKRVKAQKWIGKSIRGHKKLGRIILEGDASTKS